MVIICHPKWESFNRCNYPRDHPFKLHQLLLFCNNSSVFLTSDKRKKQGERKPMTLLNVVQYASGRRKKKGACKNFIARFNAENILLPRFYSLTRLRRPVKASEVVFVTEKSGAVAKLGSN